MCVCVCDTRGCLLGVACWSPEGHKTDHLVTWVEDDLEEIGIVVGVVSSIIP